MFTKSIGAWREGATRRRIERDVRVHPDAGQVPAPARHKAPARNARGALNHLQTTAPVQRPIPPQPDQVEREKADTARWLAQQIDRLEGGAADDETDARNLLARAAWARGVVAQLRADRARYESRPVAGACFGCGQVTETRRCWNQLEGRAVPLCPRCHPSADITDERDHDEPERVDGPWRDSDHPWGATADEPDDSEAERALDAYMAAEPPHDEDLAHADAVWHAQHPGQCCPNFMTCVECSTFQRVPGPAPDLPEALVSEPLGAPSVRSEADAAGWFDQAPDGDPPTAILPLVGAHTPRVATTRTDLEPVDGGVL